MSGVNLVAEVKPLGVNAAYKPVRWGKRSGFAKTDEANAYALRLQLAARQAMRNRDLLSGSLAVRIVFVHPDNRSDIDGPIKLTLDALEGFVYANDRQVRSLQVDYRVDKERPRVEVGIVEVTP
jgi:Holliday junction resolvase RusA-like endonuclease